MFTNEKIAEMTKMDDIMALPDIKIITKEDAEKALLKFYNSVRKCVEEYSVDDLFEYAWNLKEKRNKLKELTEEEYTLFKRGRHVQWMYSFYTSAALNLSYVDAGAELLKKLLNEAKNVDIEEVKEKLAKEYTPYYFPRVTDLFNLDEFKRALTNRKKLYIIADRFPAIKSKALDYVEMALDAGYQAFLEIDGVTKEIKYLKREETEQTPVGCVILDLTAINSDALPNLRIEEDSDLFIFLKNENYKSATKYFNLHNAHEERWHNTRKKVAVYYYKEGEKHPCDRITKGYSLYTNAFHYECYQRDKEERKEKAKEDSLGYVIEKLHDAKKEGSNLKNIIKRAKGEDAQLTEKEQEACEIIKNYTTYSIFEEKDKAEILNTALVLVEEPEEKEELPDALPCINESFDLIAELTENKTLLPELVINDIKTRAKADGYTINQVRQLFEKAIRAEEEADELSEDAQIQNAFYKLFKRLDADYYNPERHNILYLIYTILQDYSIFTI